MRKGPRSISCCFLTPRKNSVNVCRINEGWDKVPRSRSGQRERDEVQTGTGSQKRAGKGCGRSGGQGPSSL